MKSQSLEDLSSKIKSIKLMNEKKAKTNVQSII